MTDGFDRVSLREVNRYWNLIKYHRNWYAYLWYKFLRGKEGSLSLTTRKGLAIEIPEALVFTYKECFLDSTYLKGFPTTLHLEPGSKVIDIGANAGYFSLFMFERFPGVSVFGYEPIPANYALLKQYHQQFQHLDWSISNTAVAGEPGTLQLHYEGPDQFTTAASMFASAKGTQLIEVPATTLQDIIANNGLKQIDFLKLDCEGAEYDILYGLNPGQLSRIEHIAIETHHGVKPMQSQEALNVYLQEHDFQIWSKGSKIWASRK